MAKRITIMLEDDIIKKLRDLQSKQIKEYSKSVSFSGIISQILRKHVK
jgi:hypothetical protein